MLQASANGRDLGAISTSWTCFTKFPDVMKVTSHMGFQLLYLF